MRSLYADIYEYKETLYITKVSCLSSSDLFSVSRFLATFV